MWSTWCIYIRSESFSCHTKWVIHLFNSHFVYWISEETENIDWQWFAQTLNPYYEHDPSTAAMLIDDDRLIFHTIHENHWDFGIDNSGNIMNEENIDHYITRFQPMGISFVSLIPSFVIQFQTVSNDLHIVCMLFSVLDNGGWKFWCSK